MLQVKNCLKVDLRIRIFWINLSPHICLRVLFFCKIDQINLSRVMYVGFFAFLVMTLRVYIYIRIMARKKPYLKTENIRPVLCPVFFLRFISRN